MDTFSGTAKDAEKKLRGRLMGKLFKTDKRTVSQDDVDEFLRGPSDKLYMMPDALNPSTPAALPRINTSGASRWPTAKEIISSEQAQSRPANSRRRRKGLCVHFTEAQPEFIGEGGDEATDPVAEIGLRKRAQSRSMGQHIDRTQSFAKSHDSSDVSLEGRNDNKFESTRQLSQASNSSKTQTFSAGMNGEQGDIPRHTSSRARSSAAPSNRLSFAERVKEDMRSGEGQALVRAASRNSNLEEQFARLETSGEAPLDGTNLMDEAQINTMRNLHIPSARGLDNRTGHSHLSTPTDSPNSTQIMESPEQLSRTSTLNASNPPPTQPSFATTRSRQSSANLPQSSTVTMQDAAFAVGHEALRDFSKRTAHLSTLFRLSAESVKPLQSCTAEELVRAALWWFLKGRLNLEYVIRDRHPGPDEQSPNFLARQQAYADLAKSLWIAEDVWSHLFDANLQSVQRQSNNSYQEVLDSRQGILSGLRKLSMSMKRNNFLPPDIGSAPLLHSLNTSIWVKDRGDRSILASQRLSSVQSLSECFSLGDTQYTFHFGRMFVEAILVEDAAPHQYQCPALVSLVRGQQEKFLTAIVTSQDCALNLHIQADKTRGPTWKDIKWQTQHNRAEIKLPRGFSLLLNFSELDFRTIFGIYEYEQNVHGYMRQRQDEEFIFETTLRNFQCFDQNPQPQFPKDPVPLCQLRVFQQIQVVKAATGPRVVCRGFRIALNTSPKTRNLRGIDQILPSMEPIQFGFLRGEADFPALLLKIESRKSRYSMVCTFDNVKDRTLLHKLLTGTALGSTESVVAEAPIQAFSCMSDGGKCFDSLDWQSFRFINQTFEDPQPCKTVLSESLRVVLDFTAGTLTDRINVAPGELRLRLDVHSPNKLLILRPPQQDLSIAISESQVPKELPEQLGRLLTTLTNSESTRTYKFRALKDLHLFQAALTGFKVLFDGFATSFNIQRRRMVVPIHKKWDAAITRLQILQKEKVIQLIAFFEGFSHGNCMNFVLKSTDIFERSSRSGHHVLRIVDAKFALPKQPDRENPASVDHEFVSLDMPEYPGEHDDITIIFETEANLETFCKSLPAPVKLASRMGSVRR